MDYFLTYLILRLDYLSTSIHITTIVTACMFVITTIILALNQKNKEDFGLTKPWFKIISITFCVFMVFSAITPTTKQAAVVYCLPKIVNNEQVQKMPDNLLKLANQWLDGQITETTETVTETVVKSVEN